ncbi:hypothetical protein [Bacillus sp. UNCCL81]|uniref:hypothetical protein n=1 Tax=Bacillus sp. UNCCL81 TaxID=1502755 RepID=UPI0008EFB6D2|nr:hypothetical protein [Bacillus sp. UNCCL81]SFC52902.1 hypothetical protein SAMN02799633_01106 [Bacillus sp. UNCCL81]
MNNKGDLIVSECIGCNEEIFEGQPTLSQPEGMMHDDIDCIVQYVREISYIGVAKIKN